MISNCHTINICMKKYLILLLTFLCVTSAYARKGYDRNIKPTLFVPKGSWMGGVTFSYTELTGDNYKFLILDDMNGEGYTFKVSPYAGYFFGIIWLPVYV